MPTPQPQPILPPTTDEIRADALKDILAAGLLAGSVGIGARALVGSDYLFGSGSRTPATRRILPTAIAVPTPVRDDADAEADAPVKPSGRPVRSLVRDLTDRTKTAKSFLDFLSGDSAQSKPGLPWYLPATALAAVGGLAGGYRLTDKYLDQKRKADLAAELEAAKEEYRKALLANYDPAGVPAKTAADRAALGNLLDALADLAGLPAAGAAKTANDQPTEEAAGEHGSYIGDLLGRALGVYGVAALPLAGLSGLAAYNYTRDRSPSKLLQAALKQRERERIARRPPEVFAVPEPVTVAPGGYLRDA